MAYHFSTRQSLKLAPTSLGVTLGRLAVRKNKSVQDIAAATGASRVTIYSWFAGRKVSNAYQATVKALIQELRSN
jgi:hypothetical protein